MVARRMDNQDEGPREPPATTPEGREQQLVAAAFDLAEKQIRDGSVSAQVLTHFLKFGAERERLERTKLEQENLLARAKIETLAQGQRIESLYGEAIKAMREYGGKEEYDDDES